MIDHLFNLMMILLAIVISPSTLILGRKVNTNRISQDLGLPTKMFAAKRPNFQEMMYDTFWNIFYKEHLLQLKEYKHRKGSHKQNKSDC